MEKYVYKPRLVNTDNLLDVCGALDYEVLIKSVFRWSSNSHGAKADIFRNINTVQTVGEKRERMNEIADYLGNALDFLIENYENKDLDNQISACKYYLELPTQDNIYRCMDAMFGVLKILHPDLNYSAVFVGDYDNAHFSRKYVVKEKDEE